MEMFYRILFSILPTCCLLEVVRSNPGGFIWGGFLFGISWILSLVVVAQVGNFDQERGCIILPNTESLSSDKMNPNGVYLLHDLPTQQIFIWVGERASPKVAQSVGVYGVSFCLLQVIQYLFNADSPDLINDEWVENKSSQRLLNIIKELRRQRCCPSGGVRNRVHLNSRLPTPKAGGSVRYQEGVRGSVPPTPLLDPGGARTTANWARSEVAPAINRQGGPPPPTCQWGPDRDTPAFFCHNKNMLRGKNFG